MQTGSRTTYILLDRGTEDIGLLNEIHEVFAKLGMCGREVAEKFPRLLALQQGLYDEKNIDIDDG